MDQAPIIAGGGSGNSFDDDPPPEPRDGWLLVRVHVPELNVFKCLQFPSDRLVWDVKQQVLASLPKVSSFSFHSVLQLISMFILFFERSLHVYAFNNTRIWYHNTPIMNRKRPHIITVCDVIRTHPFPRSVKSNVSEEPLRFIDFQCVLQTQKCGFVRSANVNV